MKASYLLCLLLFLIGPVGGAERPVQEIESNSKERSSGMQDPGARSTGEQGKTASSITMLMCGDVMTGRGIDQVLPHPSDPTLYESYVRDARQYVEIAEKMNGPIPRPVDFFYIWGDAIEELERVAPDLRLINLETSITKGEEYWRGKGINYRMHPKNVPAIAAARIDFCSLANNHVLDWGYTGLAETLEALRKVNIKTGGAGQNLEEAASPTVLDVNGKGRIVVFSFASETSGVPRSWTASEQRPGVNLLRDLSDKTVRKIREKVKAVKQQGDIVVASIHWGANWGYEIPQQQREFAHSLIDNAGVDVIHGHSSHHPKGIEVYRDKPVLYGCGDFLNDYEGIRGYEGFRDDLGLMYFVSMEIKTGALTHLFMIPTQIKNFRVNRASGADVLWLREKLDRECKRLGTRVELNKDNTFRLRWN